MNLYNKNYFIKSTNQKEIPIEIIISKTLKIISDEAIEYKKRYKEKELSIQNQLEQKKYEILEKKKNMAEAIRKKNEDAAKNLEKFHELQEKERLKVEQDTMNKSKILLFIIYFYYSEIN